MAKKLSLLLFFFISFSALAQNDSISKYDIEVEELKEEIILLNQKLEEQEKDYLTLVAEKEAQSNLRYKNTDDRLTHLIWAVGIVIAIFGFVIRLIGKDVITKYFNETAQEFTENKINSVITEDWLRQQVENRAEGPINVLIDSYGARLKKQLQDIQKESEKYFDSFKTLEDAAMLIEERTSQEEVKPETQEVKEALATFEEGLKSTKKEQDYSAKDWFFKGKAEFEDGRFNEALDSFTHAKNHSPNDVNTHNWLGFVKSKLDLDEAAIKDFDNALSLDSKNAYAYRTRAYVKSKIGLLEEALADYDKALELEPENDTAWYNRGDLKIRLGRYKEASEDLEKALDIDDSHADTNASLAYCKIQLKDYKEAYRLNKRALEIDSNYGSALFNQGLIFHHEEKTEEACASWKKALETGFSEAKVMLDKHCNA